MMSDFKTSKKLLGCFFSVFFLVQIANAYAFQNDNDVHPNPYIAGKHWPARITFANLPGQATIKIYNPRGLLVKTIVHNAVSEGGRKAWSISGTPRGVYVYTIDSPAGQKKGRIVIQNNEVLRKHHSQPGTVHKKVVRKKVVHKEHPGLAKKVRRSPPISRKKRARVTRPNNNDVYPNPYIAGEHWPARVTFANLPGQATIKIYDLRGALIKTIAHNDMRPAGREEWDVSAAASGIYVYTIDSPAGQKKGKVVVKK